jgi:hypothetical protein
MEAARSNYVQHCTQCCGAARTVTEIRLGIPLNLMREGFPFAKGEAALERLRVAKTRRADRLEGLQELMRGHHLYGGWEIRKVPERKRYVQLTRWHICTCVKGGRRTPPIHGVSTVKSYSVLDWD